MRDRIQLRERAEMDRTYYFKIGVVIALFFWACNGDDDNLTPNDSDRSKTDASNVDASSNDASDVDAPSNDASNDGKFDSGFPKDVGSPDVETTGDTNNSLCPPKYPEIGASCPEGVVCKYSPSSSCHYDCAVICPSGCGGSYKYMKPCSTTEIRCSNGVWKSDTTGYNPCTETPKGHCTCWDSGM
jgi:hypothetical protein